MQKDYLNPRIFGINISEGPSITGLKKDFTWMAGNVNTALQLRYKRLFLSGTFILQSLFPFSSTESEAAVPFSRQSESGYRRSLLCCTYCTEKSSSLGYPASGICFLHDSVIATQIYPQPRPIFLNYFFWEVYGKVLGATNYIHGLEYPRFPSCLLKMLYVRPRESRT
jgi:hypothetical protein